MSPPNDQPVIAPHLLKVCKGMDGHFTRYVGPLAPDLSQEAFQSWTQHGKKLTTADLLGYARLLAAYIPDPRLCLQFEAEMKALLKKLR